MSISNVPNDPAYIGKIAEQYGLYGCRGTPGLLHLNEQQYRDCPVCHSFVSPTASAKENEKGV
jgi:hypothetical protein